MRKWPPLYCYYYLDCDQRAKRSWSLRGKVVSGLALPGTHQEAEAPFREQHDEVEALWESVRTWLLN